MLYSFVLSRCLLPLACLVTSTKFWNIYQRAAKVQGEQTGDSNYTMSRIQALYDGAKDDIPLWQGVSTQDSEHSEDAQFDLDTLPLSDKTTYASGFPDEVTRMRESKNFQYLSSSGTTGRMIVVTDFEKRDFQRAAEHVISKFIWGEPLPPVTLDIPPSACNVVCGLADAGPEKLFDYLKWSLKRPSFFTKENFSNINGRIERQLILRRQVVPPVDAGDWTSISAQLDSIIDTLLEDRVEVVRGLPLFLYWLAIRVNERALCFPHLKAVQPYGGLAGDAMIDTIQQSMKVPFINNYGTGEVGTIAYGNNQSLSPSIDASLRTLKAYSAVEIVNSEGKPAELGEVGEIVVTDLNNHAMPIIRYKIGDLGKALKKEGRFVSDFEIMGRVQESVTLPSGRMVTAREVQNVFFRTPEVLNFRLEQVSKAIYRATIATRAEFDTAPLQEALQALLETNKKISIKTKDFLLPEGSGKYLFVKLKK